MPTPNERVLMTSMSDISLMSNPCYRKFNENVKLFLEKYMLTSKLFPKDVTYQIMKHVDPRHNPIHSYYNSMGHIVYTHKTIFFRSCSVCRLKVVI